MKLNLTLQRILLALMAGTLLLTQIMGLHHHMHSDISDTAHATSIDLHFAGAGLHDNEHHDAASASHSTHSDIEINAIDNVLAKFKLNLLPSGLLMLVMLVVFVRRPSNIPRAKYFDTPRPLHAFALHPPANGPPGLLS